MLSDYASGNWSVTELCRRYGIGRDTFYEWRRRRDSGVGDWFVDRSHAPLQCPHRTDPARVESIVALRRRFPHLGPRKLLAILERRHPEQAWPAASTIGDLLKQAGLIAPVRRRRRPLDQQRPFTAVHVANDEWAIDFKGWFRTGDGTRVDPLTLTDSASRYLLGVQIVPMTIDGTRQALTAVFQRHGLPLAIRSDNGAPFGSNGAGGLTRLSAWWLKLGIVPHFVHPASPQENGRHERMHRTLKRQTSRPPAATAAEQQARFDAFRAHYNDERPHEAIGQVPPADLYTASTRRMPDRLEDPWYDADHEIRRIRSSGEIIWHKQPVFISLALVGELVGIAELETGDHIVRFCDYDIGLIDRLRVFRRFGPPRENAYRPPDPEPSQKLSTIIPVQSVDYHPG
ncbi:integrase core domain-containing protein [Tardiphaga alba]|uniref:integrase core domain-containing protein n=1 Tax=Tardiphaga alba TaxID=340268 RepID=UPI002010D1F0|nr:integrase core domain-containing protein [Tardiphaga alba]